MTDPQPLTDEELAVLDSCVQHSDCRGCPLDIDTCVFSRVTAERYFAAIRAHDLAQQQEIARLRETLEAADPLHDSEEER